MTDDATNQQTVDELDLKIKQAEARAAEAAANQAESDARAAEAAANQAEAEAEVGGISKLAENLSAVERGALTTTGDQPVAFNALANKALENAAKEAVKSLEGKLKGKRVFVTVDPDLATADAPYIQVSNQLKALRRRAEALLAEIDDTFKLLDVGLAAAALGAIPAVIGALSPNRTVSSSAAEVDDLNAAIAMMGALNGSCQSIILDDFRTIPSTSITDDFERLQDCRQKLAEHRLGIPDPPSGEPESSGAKEGAQRNPDEDKLVAAKLDTLIAAIDKYTSYVVAPISEGKRSPLAQASLHAVLRGDQKPSHQDCSHAVLVKGAGTSSYQVTTDMPLMLKDRISVVTHASIAFVAIRLDTSAVVKSGIATGETQMAGLVGKKITETG